MSIKRRQIISWGIGALGATLVSATPRRAHAVPGPSLSVEQLVSKSDAILAGTVTAVDDRAGNAVDGPLTRVYLAVDELVAGVVLDATIGSNTSPKQFSLTMRGGLREDGMLLRIADVPTYAVGERYLFCLRAMYYVNPLLPSASALIRAANIGGKLRAVNGISGRGLVASPALGLVQTRRFTAAETNGKIAREDADRVAAPFDEVLAVFRRRAALSPTKVNVVTGRPQPWPTEPEHESVQSTSSPQADGEPVQPESCPSESSCTEEAP